MKVLKHKSRRVTTRRKKRDAKGYWELVRKPVPLGGYAHASRKKYNRKRLKRRLRQEEE